ncbi:glycoside hydrolase family 99-like domain-containing protein [Knoellia sp. CPCC 206435]|uniref:glycosyltransferase WbsX family protein n=1 Tax=Knoellia terrae TaxID=3404797 RepID=UPI003B4356A9
MRVVAFYLPQFHTIPENDEWWGQGFTEWVNVRKASPAYLEHDHPRTPTTLGEYDLTNSHSLRAQSQLAQKHGIDAFCMYFYWFDGRRLLERPVDAWREDATLLPYCLSWANEAWTRRWDGRNRDVLMPQTYPRDYTRQLFHELLPHFQAGHYVKVLENPVLVVHRADLIPDPLAFSRDMRLLAHEAGLPGIYLIASETLADTHPGAYAFDAVAEFPPVSANRLGNAQMRRPIGLDSQFRGRLLSYQRIVRHYLNRPVPDFIRHPGVMPGWDNTARRGLNATIYVGHSPTLYEAWLREALRREEVKRGSQGFVFVNAWNEWAEGAYLEPDETHGDAFLQATHRAKTGIQPDAHTTAQPMTAGFSWSHTQSLGKLASGSVLARIRSFRNRRRGSIGSN